MGDELTELLKLQEPLDPELEACIWEAESGMVFIKHPLVNTLHMPGTEAVVNRQLRYKREELAKVRAEGGWCTFIMLHERPWRYEALQMIADDVDDETFWQLVQIVWMDSENIRENQDEWDDLLRSERPGHEAMMTEDERQALAEMDDVIPVYQGHTDERDDGWSWTTDKAKAEWFGHRFARLEGGVAMMTAATVRRDDVLAYLTGRDEYEILVDPDLVLITGTVEL